MNDNTMQISCPLTYFLIVKQQKNETQMIKSESALAFCLLNQKNSNCGPSQLTVRPATHKQNFTSTSFTSDMVISN